MEAPLLNWMKKAQSEMGLEINAIHHHILYDLKP